MCKQCKLKKRIKNLEAEIAELKSRIDGYGHFIYPNLTGYSYIYPLGTAATTSYVWPNPITYTDPITGGNGEG